MDLNNLLDAVDRRIEQYSKEWVTEGIVVSVGPITATVKLTSGNIQEALVADGAKLTIGKKCILARATRNSKWVALGSYSKPLVGSIIAFPPDPAFELAPPSSIAIDPDIVPGSITVTWATPPQQAVAFEVYISPTGDDDLDDATLFITTRGSYAVISGPDDTEIFVKIRAVASNFRYSAFSDWYSDTPSPTDTGAAPTDATYITQTPHADLSAEQALSTLATGLMKVTTGTGVVTSVNDSAGLAGAIGDETGSGALVFGTAPTLSAPAIADFTSAQHDHLDADDGGTLSAAAITSGTLLHERGGLEADVSAYDGYIRIAGGTTTNIKSTFDSTTAPTVNDDSGDGFVIGSRWLDTTNDKEYVALDVTVGAAVWVETTGAAGGAPVDATYITQTPNGTLSAEQALSSLATGIMKVTTGTGVVSSITDSAGVAAAISDETGTGLLVFNNTPTLLTPTIADFTNAQHDHSDADDGGLVDASVITYTPVSNADWNGGADPGDVNDGLDQLADRVTNIEDSNAARTNSLVFINY